MDQVEAAGIVNFLPFNGGSAATTVAVADPADGLDGEDIEVQFSSVSPGYLEAMRIPLRAGRYFDERDWTTPAVIVSESAARYFWGTAEAVDRRLKLGGAESRNSWAAVRGVVGDVRHDSLFRDSQPTVYIPSLHSTRESLVIRTRGIDSLGLWATSMEPGPKMTQSRPRRESQPASVA